MVANHSVRKQEVLSGFSLIDVDQWGGGIFNNRLLFFPIVFWKFLWGDKAVMKGYQVMTGGINSITEFKYQERVRCYLLFSCNKLSQISLVYWGFPDVRSAVRFTTAVLSEGRIMGEREG